MYHQLLISCVIIFANFVICAYGQEEVCKTAKGESGTCINLRKCSYMMRLLINRRQEPDVVNYLQESSCGFSGNDPLVCCPENPEDDDNNVVANSKDQNNVHLPSKPQCGLSNLTNSKIVGGVPAKLNEFPFMAILGYKNAANLNFPKWLCGGTLITERHVLTAAHCTNNRKDLYLVRVGELILYDETDGASPEDILISNVKSHEDFSATEFTNDIAVLTLERKPNNPMVWPVCLPIVDPIKTNSYVGENGVVTGWGSIHFDGPRSAALRVADMPIVNESYCQKAFGQNTVIDNRIICAGWITGAKDTCQGDSGGPLMVAIQEGKFFIYYQIGIISYGFRCAEPGYPGVFTKVTNYLDWIQKNIV